VNIKRFLPKTITLELGFSHSFVSAVTSSSSGTRSIKRATMAVGKNKRISKGKKGGKKKA
jgi:hypothetical protein